MYSLTSLYYHPSRVRRLAPLPLISLTNLLYYHSIIHISLMYFINEFIVLSQYYQCISLMNFLYHPSRVRRLAPLPCISLMNLLYYPCVSLMNLYYHPPRVRRKAPLPLISLMNLLYYQCISLMNLLYYQCIINVLSMYYQCIINVYH